MNLTDEQKAIIEETISNKPGTYGIEAVAGSGKSFTIFQAIDFIKEHEPNAKVLYLVFNKANQIDAEFKLRKYQAWKEPVDVRTAHSFAYNKWLQKIGPFTAVGTLDWGLICKVIREVRPYYYNPDIKFSKRAPFDWLHDKFVTSKLSLHRFCEEMKLHFDDTYIGADKAGTCEIINKFGNKIAAEGIQVNAYSVVTPMHIDAFEDIIKMHKDSKIYTHPMYLKEAAYAQTRISQYDYVFFDEAQDANYFMLMLLDKQEVKKKYFVGDSRQSIYQFGGSTVNVFDELAFDKKYTLSQSFRFGDDIASLANHIVHLNSEQTVYGTEQTYETNPDSKAYLYRTNAKLFQDALGFAYEAKCANISLKIDLLKTDMDESAYTEILAFLKLYYKSVDPQYYQEYKSFFPERTPASLQTLENMLKEGAKFLNAYNELYDAMSDDIHSIFNYVKDERTFIEKYVALKGCLKNTSPEKVLTLVTMHRSKGLQWDNVIIAEPTRLYYTDKDGVKRRNQNALQELNLAYVAVTRARKNLNAIELRHELCCENEKFEKINFIVKEKILQEA